MKDLIVLVADKDMELTVLGLLSRPQSLGICAIQADVFVHPRRDPGCLLEAHAFLQPYSTYYRCALVMFDYEGCGREKDAPQTLAGEVKTRLRQTGWAAAEVVVLVPELEVWVWSASPHVADCLGWTTHRPALRAWLAEQQLWPCDKPKPPEPRVALERALREVGKPRSSGIYWALAKSVSLQGHQEPAFRSLVQCLREWFPANQ